MKKYILGCLIIASFLQSCKKDDESCATPSQAVAGADLKDQCAGRIKLDATAPEFGKGTWSIISGSGGNILSPNDPKSEFTGLAGVGYVLRWTVSIDCSSTATQDDVEISFKTSITSVTAGEDQVICTTQINLSATKPDGTEGTWLISSGEGGNIEMPASPSSKFTGTKGVTYTLVWRVTNGCSDVSDGVQIKILPDANAGDDKTVPATSINLSGNDPGIGNSGSWSIQFGEGGKLTDPTDFKTSFTGLFNKAYVLRWTTTTKCGTSFDDVVIAMVTPKVTSILNNGELLYRFIYNDDRVLIQKNTYFQDIQRETETYTYNEKGLLKSTKTTSSGLTQNRNFEYNEANQLISLVVTNSDNDTGTTTYSYTNGNLTNTTSTYRGYQQTFTYSNENGYLKVVTNINDVDGHEDTITTLYLPNEPDPFPEAGVDPTYFKLIQKSQSYAVSTDASNVTTIEKDERQLITKRTVTNTGNLAGTYTWTYVYE